MPPVINSNLCLKCGSCVDVCPMDVFYGSKKGEIPIVTYPEECWHAEACALHCPANAIDFRIPLTMVVPIKKLHIEKSS